MSTKYRKKPVEVEAYQFDGDNGYALADWINNGGSEAECCYDRCNGGFAVYVETLEGTMQAAKGDWIIRGTEGEFYPVKGRDLSQDLRGGRVMIRPVPYLECPFCQRIEAGDVDGELDGVFDFEPLNPVTPGHRLFVPREHVQTAGTMPHVTGRVFRVASRFAAELDPAFNLITSAGTAATQTVAHLHIHYIPRRAGDGLHLPWTGQSPVPATPERESG